MIPGLARVLGYWYQRLRSAWEEGKRRARAEDT